MSREHIIQTKKQNAPPKTKTEAQARKPQHPMEEMQALYGNRAVNQLLASQPRLQAKPMFGGLSGELQHSPMQGKGGQTPTVLQAKLENGAVGDKHENEADRDAAQELDRQKTPARALSTQEQLVQRQESKKEDVKDLAENTVQNGQQERKRTNQTGLPDALKAGVENLSGYSLDDVRVHYNSPKPTQLQALAYTQGTEIHVAPGQEEHLPHEAWHVVQQMQGRVKPTMQMKGVQINDDQRLEREADEMDKNIAKRPIEGSDLAINPKVEKRTKNTIPLKPKQLRRVERANLIVQRQIRQSPNGFYTDLDLLHFFGTSDEAHTHEQTLLMEVPRKLKLASDAIQYTVSKFPYGPQNQIWARNKYGEGSDVNMGALVSLMDKTQEFLGGYNNNWLHPRRLGAAAEETGGGNCQEYAAVAYNYMREHADANWTICYVVNDSAHHSYATIGVPIMMSHDIVVVADAWVQYPRPVTLSQHFCNQGRHQVLAQKGGGKMRDARPLGDK
ncbi:MAG: DUF4157 domain-containing protein [Gloeotrichia echinulata HAB0833]